MAKNKCIKKSKGYLIKSFIFFIILGFIIYFIYPIIKDLLHEHEFINGECECGETDPDYEEHVHEFINGECECGETDPDYEEHVHEFINGECECGETDPDYEVHVHEYIDGKCECGEIDSDYIAPHVHNYIDGVCDCGDVKPEQVIESDTLSIHFLELGNRYTGDCIYIKAGETDILIDAGSRGNSADDITNYINKYVEDNTLEYVIATHAHQDHIAGFVGTSQVKGIFEEFICEVIIDFPMTDATSKVYENYVILREEEVKLGAKHYTALECYNNVNGAKRVIEIAEGIELEILYNYYYENKASTENDYSVCLMINQNDKHFLFTGDLEHKGEEKLVELNDLPKVEVLKAGHHGSYTATTDVLLEVVDPEIVCVCCCCGSDEYTKDINNMFPSQEFVSRVSKYTDKIYVTSIIANNEEGFTSLNGNINIISTKDSLEVICSNNNTIFKETAWFKENRKWE